MLHPLTYRTHCVFAPSAKAGQVAWEKSEQYIELKDKQHVCYPETYPPHYTPSCAKHYSVCNCCRDPNAISGTQL